MRLRTKAGEAVMLVIMGVMIVGGVVVWLSTGHFHMMPMHGDKHTVDKHAQEESVSSAPNDSHHGSGVLSADGHPMEHNEQDIEEK